MNHTGLAGEPQCSVRPLSRGGCSLLRPDLIPPDSFAGGSCCLSSSEESQDALHVLVTREVFVRHLLCARVGCCPQCRRHRLNASRPLPSWGSRSEAPVTRTTGLPGLCSWWPQSPGDARLQRSKSDTLPRAAAGFQLALSGSAPPCPLVWAGPCPCRRVSLGSRFSAPCLLVTPVLCRGTW